MLPLLESLRGEVVPAAQRPARVVLVDDASPVPVVAGELPDGSSWCAGPSTAASAPP